MTKKGEGFCAIFQDFIALSNHFKVEGKFCLNRSISRHGFEKDFDNSNIIVDPLELKLFS